jgi:hypothetical protein
MVGGGRDHGIKNASRLRAVRLCFLPKGSIAFDELACGSVSGRVLSVCVPPPRRNFGGSRGSPGVVALDTDHTTFASWSTVACSCDRPQPKDQLAGHPLGSRLGAAGEQVAPGNSTEFHVSFWADEVTSRVPFGCGDTVVCDVWRRKATGALAVKALQLVRMSARRECGLVMANKPQG